MSAAAYALSLFASWMLLLTPPPDVPLPAVAPEPPPMITCQQPPPVPAWRRLDGLDSSWGQPPCEEPPAMVGSPNP